MLSLTAQPIRVGIFMDFEWGPGPTAMAAMEQEVDKLLKPSGIALDWRLAKENRGDRSSLVLVRFKGTCKAERPAGAGDFGSLGVSHALASTKISEGRVLPFKRSGM